MRHNDLTTSGARMKVQTPFANTMHITDLTRHMYLRWDEKALLNQTATIENQSLTFANIDSRYH
jgi:hypothetical protein